MTLDEFTAEFKRLSELLDKGITSMRTFAVEYADAESAYREAKGKAWLLAPEGTVPEREAWVNRSCRTERRARDLADDMRKACTESVRSRRAQISALQTLLNAHEAEAGFARTGPRSAA